MRSIVCWRCRHRHMAFRFTLAPLLRLRQSLERQRSLALQRAAMNLHRGEEAMAHLQRFLAESTRADSASLAEGRRSAELHFATLLRAQLHVVRDQLQEEIRRLAELRNQAALAYTQAMREREVLEALRARQHHAYQQEQAHNQQRQLDDTFLLQRWHRRSG